jgi:hypothetical protein
MHIHSPAPPKNKTDWYWTIRLTTFRTLQRAGRLCLEFLPRHAAARSGEASAQTPWKLEVGIEGGGGAAAAELASMDEKLATAGRCERSGWSRRDRGIGRARAPPSRYLAAAALAAAAVEEGFGVGGFHWLGGKRGRASRGSRAAEERRSLRVHGEERAPGAWGMAEPFFLIDLAPFAAHEETLPHIRFILLAKTCKIVHSFVCKNSDKFL